MGYTTDFQGSFKLDKPLTAAHAAYLHLFSETRRMKRVDEVASSLPDPVRIAAGLPVGRDGGYFVGAGGDFGQGDDASIVDRNGPPGGQPGLWCQWVPNERGPVMGSEIEWNGGEKFYYYVEWLTYLIDHFLGPWGYMLDGKVTWVGEDSADTGTITVKRNVVSTTKSRRR